MRGFLDTLLLSLSIRRMLAVAWYRFMETFSAGERRIMTPFTYGIWTLLLM
jgi:hypothetical protein